MKMLRAIGAAPGCLRAVGVVAKGVPLRPEWERGREGEGEKIKL
jgi:hypothetical protein